MASSFPIWLERSQGQKRPSWHTPVKRGPKRRHYIRSKQERQGNGGTVAVVTVIKPVILLAIAQARIRARQVPESGGKQRRGSATSRKTGFAVCVQNPMTSHATPKITGASTVISRATSSTLVDSVTPTSRRATPPKIDNQQAPSQQNTLLTTAKIQETRQNSELTSFRSPFPHPSTPTFGPP